MSRDRGYLPRRDKLRSLPFVVEVPRPRAGGVWRELDAMYIWARRACGSDGYMTTSREDRTGPGLPKMILRVHFGDESKARAFAREFGLSYP
jgi:hypothetical protein